MSPEQRRGRTLSSSARGALPPTLHGPLQRLLGVRERKLDERIRLTLGIVRQQEECTIHQTCGAKPCLSEQRSYSFNVRFWFVGMNHDHIRVVWAIPERPQVLSGK